MELLTIGEVSKLCHIPIKTLRYYDEIDLLKPDKISQENNYRYYSQESILKIPLIKYYKQLGFKLDHIKRFLERMDFRILEDYFSKELLVVEKQIADLEKKHAAITEWHRLLKYGEQLLAESTASQEETKIHVTTIPLYKTVRFTYEVMSNPEDMEILYNNSFVDFCNKNDVFAYGPFMLYFDSCQERITNTFSSVECYTSIFEEAHNATITENVGNFKALTAIHKGDYKQIGRTYLSMLHWAKKQAIPLQGASYERYIIDPWSTIFRDNYITEIILPIQT